MRTTQLSLSQLTEPKELEVNPYFKAFSFRIVCYTALGHSTMKNQPFKPNTYSFCYNDLVLMCEKGRAGRMLETDPSFCYLPHSVAMASAAVFSDHLGDGVVNSPLRVRPGEKRAHEKAFLSSNPLLQCLSFLQSGLTSFLSLPPNTLTYHIPHTPAYIYTITHSHTHAHIRTQPPSLS